ncbi:MAG: cobalamin biosynthesis protein CbiG [Pseudomonadota bacterium]
MTRLFDVYLAADWSAANAPTRGKDSIWIAVRGVGTTPWCENIATRNEAEELLGDVISETLARDERLLAGFDFAFGYPEGFAAKVTGAADWEAMWSAIAAQIDDQPTNQSNRFAVGEALNEAFGAPVFWGKPHQQAALYPSLPTKRPDTDFPAQRAIEKHVSGAKSVFQLAYNGAVGSQTLLGIPALARLRGKTGAKIWPFETQFTECLPDGPCAVFAEIYPSLLVARAPDGAVKDQAQVEAMADAMMAADQQGTMVALLNPPAGVTATERAAMVREEGSILGAGIL